MSSFNTNNICAFDLRLANSSIGERQPIKSLRYCSLLSLLSFILCLVSQIYNIKSLDHEWQKDVVPSINTISWAFGQLCLYLLLVLSVHYTFRNTLVAISNRILLFLCILIILSFIVLFVLYYNLIVSDSAFSMVAMYISSAISFNNIILSFALGHLFVNKLFKLFVSTHDNHQKLGLDGDRYCVSGKIVFEAADEGTKITGTVTGLNKPETVEEHGKEQVLKWRRSLDIPPPEIDEKSQYNPANEPKYKKFCEAKDIPKTECSKDVIAPTEPYWKSDIEPELKAGKSVLVAADGNSIRGIVKATAPLSGVLLGDPAAIKRAQEKVKNKVSKGAAEEKSMSSSQGASGLNVKHDSKNLNIKIIDLVNGYISTVYPQSEKICNDLRLIMIIIKYFYILQFEGLNIKHDSKNLNKQKSRLKAIPHKTRDLVNGYLRRSGGIYDDLRFLMMEFFYMSMEFVAVANCDYHCVHDEKIIGNGRYYVKIGNDGCDYSPWHNMYTIKIQCLSVSPQASINMGFTAEDISTLSLSNRGQDTNYVNGRRHQWKHGRKTQYFTENKKNVIKAGDILQFNLYHSFVREHYEFSYFINGEEKNIGLGLDVESKHVFFMDIDDSTSRTNFKLVQPQ